MNAMEMCVKNDYLIFELREAAKYYSGSRDPNLRQQSDLCRRAADALASQPEGGARAIVKKHIPSMPSADEIRLACGELTAAEMRTTKAVLQWFINTRCKPQKSGVTDG